MRIAAAADTFLDRTVVAGYTAPGLALRRRAPGWSDELPSMAGRTVAITGPTSGIGEAAAARFAALGATVLLLVRNREKGATTRERIVAERVRHGGEIPDVRLVTCDIADLTSVRACAEQLRKSGEPLHVLVHNAGAMPPERKTSPDGIELSWATNVVGPFLLTSLLQERLVQSAPARVITVSSGGMFTQRLDVDDPEGEHREYRPASAYARAKRAQVVLNELWSERLRGLGVTFHAMHPGWVDTPGVQDSLPGFHKLTGKLLRSPDEGADTIVWLGAADAPAGRTGLFWHDRRARPTHRVPWTREDPADRQRLWALCREQAGLPASA
ncbi:MAG: SDR family NAD(P)-dependent oxidoreductase [Patulibacter sp.]